MSTKTEKRILWGMILLYIVVFGAFACLHHYNFQTQAWDMAVFDQTFWNTIHGRIMQNSFEMTQNHFGVHMSPFLFLLVPGYMLFSSPYYLIIIQTLALALGALPLYLLARKFLKQAWLPLFISAAYLIYPSLHWVNIYDFHEIAFFPLFFLTAFYFLEMKNWRWATLFMMLTASVKEDAILAVMFLGIYLLIKDKMARKMSLMIILLSLIYFFISMKVVLPLFSEGFSFLYRYGHLGQNFTEIVKNIFVQPNLFIQTIFNAPKFYYLAWLFAPLAFLPFFSGRALVLLIPGLAENLLSNFESQFSNFYQYDALLIPGIFVCLIFGFKNILNRWPGKEKILQWLLTIAILGSFVVRSPLGPQFFPTELIKSTPRSNAFRQMVQLVEKAPKDVSMAVHTNLAPHLSRREHIYVNGLEPFQTDVVLLDTDDPSLFIYENVMQEYLDNYMRTGDYERTMIDGQYLILIKKEFVID